MSDSGETADSGRAGVECGVRSWPVCVCCGFFLDDQAEVGGEFFWQRPEAEGERAGAGRARVREGAPISIRA